jgi:hypothetical protein
MKLTKTGELRMTKQLTKPSTALIAIDDVIDNLPFIVRRDHRIVAAFAKKAAALDSDAFLQRRVTICGPYRE